MTRREWEHFDATNGEFCSNSLLDIKSKYLDQEKFISIIKKISKRTLSVIKCFYLEDCN